MAAGIPGHNRRGHQGSHTVLWTNTDYLYTIGPREDGGER